MNSYLKVCFTFFDELFSNYSSKKNISTHNCKGMDLLKVGGGVLLTKHTTEIPTPYSVHLRPWIWQQVSVRSWEDLSSRIGKDRFGASHF